MNSSAISIEDVSTNVPLELHINVGYVSFYCMKPCGLFYLIQTATYLVVVLKAVSKIKAFTILIGFRISV
jgi:hypothetical protein